LTPSGKFETIHRTGDLVIRKGSRHLYTTMSHYLLALALALTAVYGLGLSLFFSFVHLFGSPGRKFNDWLLKAPGIDLALAVAIWIPWIIGFIILGWKGLGAVVPGQILALHVWIFFHEFFYRKTIGEHRIVSYLNKRFGWWKNHLALWVTTIVLPVFFLIRIAQIIIYPLLVWLLGFRTYRHSEWINVSRQKFSGLVGHDLIWCLYCDWMTGVFSLGAEMLRNVESFWCPIRFYHDKKCANCQIDFPDLSNGWVENDGTMEDVVETLDKHMPEGKPWSWFGDPDKQ